MRARACVRACVRVCVCVSKIPSRTVGFFFRWPSIRCTGVSGEYLVWCSVEPVRTQPSLQLLRHAHHGCHGHSEELVFSMYTSSL